MESVTLVIQRIEQILDTAYFGLRVLKGGDPSERSAGLRNELVFGRSVTWVIQNLKPIVGEHRFDDWYRPYQKEMMGDPLMRYFVVARNNLEKQGRLDVSNSALIHKFDSSMLAHFEAPPFPADSFFISDEHGGSGWEMDLGGGESIKYYVNIPSSVAEVKQVFHSLPENIPEELRSLSTYELCVIYLDKLKVLVSKTKKEFLPHPAERPYLRLIK